jgi:hypothetical protein
MGMSESESDMINNPLVKHSSDEYSPIEYTK